MGSAFAGIEMGKRSLMAHTEAINTAGHNVSNAEVKGYSRQRVEMRPFDPLYRPDLSRAETPGQLGQGIAVQSVERLRDELLDTRITAQANEETYWETRDKYYTMLDQIYNEPSLQNNMNSFWEGWQELAAYPDAVAGRQAIVTRGETLVDTVKQRNIALNGVGQLLNGDIEKTVVQINDYAKEIASVNGEIVRSKAMGDNPNDLLDRRDLLVDQLSGLVNITTDRRDADEFMVHIGGQVLVQGMAYRSFDTVSRFDDTDYVDVVWHDTGVDARITKGTLGALIELRDVDVRDDIQELNTMALNFSDLVNDVHRNATGANGRSGLDFFVQQPFVPNVAGNYDRSGDGVEDSTYLFRMTGTNTLRASEQTGLQGVITLSGRTGNVEIPYNPADSVQTLVARINNSDSEVKAYLDRENRLVLKATAAADRQNPDFVIRHVEDSGFFLTGYAGVLEGAGADNAYDFAQIDAVNALAGVAAGAEAMAAAEFSVAPVLNPSAYMAVNEAIHNDVLSVASAYAGVNGYAESGDGRAASEIASIRNTAVMIGRNRTIDDYFAESVARVGENGRAAKLEMQTQNTMMGDLRNLRESISGVNMEEELANLIKFQHGYNAAAKFVSIVDSLLDTVINRLGV